MFRDAAGIELKEGDLVAFPMQLGQSLVAVVVKTESGISSSSDPRQRPQPMVYVQVTIPVPADPGGTIALFKTAMQQKQNPVAG